MTNPNPVAGMTREQLVATIHEGFTHTCGDSAAPYCQREAEGFADWMLANPDVVLRALGAEETEDEDGRYFIVPVWHAPKEVV